MKQQGFALPDRADLLHVDLDWFTVSWAGAASACAPSFEQLRGLYDLYVLRGEMGEQDKPQNQGGYVGRRYGSLWLGERQGDVLVRCSSWPAGVLAPFLHGSGGRCTRVDVQATVRVEGSPDEVVSRSAISALRGREGAQGRPWKVAHIRGFGDGDLASVGGRSSELYLRIYNKGAESPDQPEYTSTVRFEAECKGVLAEHVWREVAGAEDRQAAALDMLHALLSKRGLPDLGRFNDGRLPLWDLPKMKTDAQKQLDWLERNVSGTVQKLILDGWKDWVYDALGLDK